MLRRSEDVILLVFRRLGHVERWHSVRLSVSTRAVTQPPAINRSTRLRFTLYAYKKPRIHMPDEFVHGQIEIGGLLR